MASSSKRYLRVPALLEQLAQARYPQTLSQLASRLQLPKTSVMRILETLVDMGLVTQVPGNRTFVPGPAAARLALSLLQAPQFSRDVRAILASVVQATGESCNLTALEDEHMRYIERVEGAHSLRLSMSAGDRVPLHCTATGKLALALMDRHEREATLSHLTLQRYTAKTATDRDSLMRELDAICHTRIGIDRQEFVWGMVAIAVPVIGSRGQMVAALSCHGPTARISIRALESAVPMMRTAAERLSQVLGLGAESLPPGSG